MAEAEVSIEEAMNFAGLRPTTAFLWLVILLAVILVGGALQ